MRWRRSAFLLAGIAVAATLGGCASPAAAPMPATTSSRSAAPSPSPSPTPSPTPATAEEEARERLAGMSVRQKLAAMLMLHYPGTDGPTLTEFMRSTGAGGFIVMGDNVAGPAAEVAATTAALTVDPTLPPLIGVDQEGGDVSRLDDDTAPSAVALKSLPPQASRDAFAARAAVVAAAGINLNFGIVADETGDPNSFIVDRVLGATPEDAAARVEQAVQGEHGVVLSTLKHFPGHGLTEAD